MSEHKPVFIPDSVKVEAHSKLARSARISIGGVLIPFTYAAVEFRPDALVTLTIETRADLVDVEVLQSQTEVMVRQIPDQGDPSKN